MPQRRRAKRFTVFSVSRKKVVRVSQEEVTSLKEERLEAEPLLSEEQLIAEMREIFAWLVPAFECSASAHPGQYRDFGYEHLHVIGHLFALTLCLRYRQPLHKFEGEQGMICKLLREYGV